MREREGKEDGRKGEEAHIVPIRMLRTKKMINFDNDADDDNKKKIFRQTKF